MSKTKKSKKKRIYYYGVAGINGYAVYTDYDRALDAQNFLYASRIKKYLTFEDAKFWATERFWGLQNPMKFLIDFLIDIEQIEKTNWTYYKKKEEIGSFEDDEYGL